MLSAKNEKNAIGATLLFNFAHYALRPWPWIVVAMASLIIYPDLDSIRIDFPTLSETYLKDDIAYPVMLSKLSAGWLGLVVASIIAAYMSTIGTHLNWGSSYVVNDFYRRFVRKGASEKEFVMVGRICTVTLMVIAGIFALTFLNNATQAFDILLLSGAGSGAIYLLRWFWWRINAWTEIVAMIFATALAVVLVFIVPDEAVVTTNLDAFTVKLLIAVTGTTIVWLLTTFLTKPEKMETLYDFFQKVHPGGPGWKKVVLQAESEGKNINEKEAGKKWEMPQQLLMVFFGLVVIYGSLFSIGSFVYGSNLAGIITGVIAAICTVIMFRLLDKLRVDSMD